MRRELWETLVELLVALTPDNDATTLRVTSMHLDLPVELRLRQGSDGLRLLADLPRWRWRAGMSEPLGRMQIVIHEEAMDG
jgi:hypothetical protein